MITEYEKFNLVDANDRKTGVTMEVNWDKDPEKNECKIIKMTLPDKSTHYIKRDMFNAFLFAIGKEEDQRKMIPQKITRSKWYETVVSVTTTKDIKKGEKLTFPLKLTLPDERREAIEEVKHDIKKKKTLIEV